MTAKRIKIMVFKKLNLNLYVLLPMYEPAEIDSFFL